MAVARGFGLNGKSSYVNICKPQSVFVSFVVDATVGVGISSLKSNGYAEYVFMHTSTTPTSTNGHLNPNPSSGFAVVSLKNNFNKFLSIRADITAPATSTTATSTTTGSPYVITSLGTATAAQWLAAGLPSGFTAAVGQTFVAIATATIGGSATVGTPGVSNVGAVSVVGDPNAMIANAAIGANAGAQVMVQFEDFAGAAVAPTALSVVRLELFFDGSSVTIDGL